MARNPTCVGVIVYEIDEVLNACTISSFTSISVDNGNESVIFTLKKESKTGKDLQGLDSFAVCILSSEQEKIARIAGSNLDRSEIQRELKEFVIQDHNDRLCIGGSYLNFFLKLEKKITLEKSEIYVCKVLSGYENTSGKVMPMIYSNRKFTTVREFE